MKEPTAPVVNPNDRLGVTLVVGSAVGLGLAMAVSRFAYDDGANGLALGTGRALFFVPALFLFCRLTGRRLRVSFEQWRHTLGLGALMGLGFYGHVGAIEFIPVGLAAILFFTFPPVIAVIQAVLNRELPGVGQTLALLVSFCGLAVMLGVSFEAADPKGIMLALGAAVCVAWNTVWTARKLSHLDGAVVVFHMGVVAAVVLSAVCLFTGYAELPMTPIGWTGLVLVALLQTVSLPLFYLALPRVGALKAGMVVNIQPVVSIVAAFVLFAEVMTLIELAGGALVLLGIWMMQRLDKVPSR